MPWCEDEHVLASVFPLSHIAACTSQEEARVLKLCSLLGDFHQAARVRIENLSLHVNLHVDCTVEDPTALDLSKHKGN